MKFHAKIVKAIVILGAVIATISCGGEGISEPLSGAPEGVYPLPAQGNSSPVSLKPLPGISISAPANAMVADHPVSFDFADSGDWKIAKKALENEETIPLCAFEFDAGMGADDIMPGLFTFNIDLKEMGIPPSLYDRVQVWRVPQSDPDKHYRYSVIHLDGDSKLKFRSNQNSLIVVALGTAFVTYGVLKLVHSIQEYYLREYFFHKRGWNDCMSVDIDDPNGNFTLYFKFSDTERPNGADAYLKNEKAALKRLAELEKKADELVEQMVNLIVSDNAEMGWWDRWKLRNERDAARKRINREAILNDLIAYDPELIKLNNSPDAKLPEGILRVIEMVKWSNQYLNQAKVMPLNIRMEVYIVDDTVIDTDAGRCVKRVGGKPLLLINLKNLYEVDSNGKKYFSFSPKKGQSSLNTIAHELFHARQQTNYCPIHMAMYPAEATATVLEYDAARWFYKTHRINTDIDGPDGDKLEMSPRNHMEIFARSLDEIITTDKYSILDIASPSRLWKKTKQSFIEASNVGYTLGYVIEAARELSADKTRSMHYVVAEYPEHGSSFSEMTRRGLSMTEKEFDKAWVHFCDKHMSDLYMVQYNLKLTDIDAIVKDCYAHELTIGEGRPVEELKIDKKNYYYRAWKVYKQKGSSREFNFFVARKDGKISPTVKFYVTDQKHPMKNGGNTPLRFLETPEVLEVSATVTSNYFNQRDEEYYAVCLYKPRKIELKKVKDNSIEFTLPKVASVFKKKGFLTGAEVTFTPAKGEKLTRIINFEDLEKKVTWEIEGVKKMTFKLTVKWFYKEDDENIFKSPESDPVKHGAEEIEEVEEVEVPADTVVTAGEAEVISMPQEEPDYFYDGDFVFTHVSPQQGIDNLGEFFKEHRVVGHVSASGGHYTLTIPAFSGTWNGITYNFSEIVAEGEYKAGAYGGLWITGLQEKCSPFTVKVYWPDAGRTPLNVTKTFTPLTKEEVGFSALFELKRFDENKKTRFSIYIKANITAESNWASYRIENPERDDFWIHGYITIPGYEPILYH